MDIVNCIVCDAVKLSRMSAKKECRLVNRKGDEVGMIKLLKQLFCLHDYIIASQMDRVLRGINYYVCTKCGKKSLYGD